MKTRAAILYEYNTPLVVEEVDLADPGPGEVLVKVGATGVCHSDLHIIKGEWTRPLPTVLGHEAAGTVVACGEGVDGLRPGQKVIFSFRPNCGHCFYCHQGHPVLCEGRQSPYGTFLDGRTRLSKNGQPIYHMARVASFAEHAVTLAEQLVPIPDEMPLPPAALIGCAVMTGVGAVMNTAQVQPGSSVAVIGCGGVGLNVIQGARLAGANTIIAVDLLDNKLDYARRFGATHVVNAGREDPVQRVKELTRGRGADYTFEVIGRGATIRQAVDAARPRGTVTIVGMAPSGEEARLDAYGLAADEKLIRGSWYGSARPLVDMPKMVDLYLSGKLQVDELISRTYALDEINEGFDLLRRGEVARGVIVME
ncbi:MAG TPA: Zn-dependent alcohol dehydrogenase [Chloroflexota bacterium]